MASVLQRGPVFTTEKKTKTNPSQKKRRAGLFKAEIGSTHVIRVGKRDCQYTVKDLSKCPTATVRAMCLLCAKTWDSGEDLVDAHPEHETMEKRGEAHVFCLFSYPTEDSSGNKISGKVTPESLSDPKLVTLLSDQWPEVK